MRPRPAPMAARIANSRPRGRPPREQHVGDVRAGDEEHRADHGHQHEQGFLEQAARGGETARPGQQRDRDALALPGPGTIAPFGFVLRPREVRQARFERRNGGARRHATDDANPPVMPRVPGSRRHPADLRVHRQRQVEAGRDGGVGPVEAAPRDADDRQRVAAHPDRPPDDRGITPEPGLPGVVAEHDERRGAQLAIVGGIEEPTRLRGHAEDREVVARDELALRELGRVGRAAVRHLEADGLAPRGGRERHPRPVAEGQVVGIVPGHSRVGTAARDEPQLLWSANRQRLQEQRVDQGEDRGIGADAERQRQHGDRRRGRRAAQRPGGPAGVGEAVLQDNGQVHGRSPVKTRRRGRASPGDVHSLGT